MFKKFKEYIQIVCDEGKDNDDITPYFEQKAELLWYSLIFYTEKLNNIYNDTDKFLLSDFKKDFLSEETLIGIFKKFLGDDYQVPRDDLIEMQHHLYALWFFFTFTRPNGIFIETLFKLDLAAHELSIITTSFGTIIPVLINEKNSIDGRTQGNRNQRETGKANILKAYESFCSEYKIEIFKNSKKYYPVIDGKKETLFSLASDVGAKMSRETRYSQKHIENRLRELLDEGKIQFSMET